MLDHHGIFRLPRPLNRRLDKLASGFLYQPDRAVDFSKPCGERALVPADSVSWIIFKNPISLFIGGVAAVLLEMAEPRVRDGVWDHSTFRTDALKRLQRTGLAAMTTVYGPKSAAETMIAHVVRMHGRVQGLTSEGEAYSANDPALLDWVQATATYGFLEAYHAYVRPLNGLERDRLFEEAQISARLYGATGAPTSQADMDLILEAMASRLVPSPILFEFLEIMATIDGLPRPVQPLRRPMIRAAIAILPHWVRDRLGLASDEWALKPWQRQLVKAAARVSDRLVLSSSPAVQSCRRLGLADDYLYQRR